MIILPDIHGRTFWKDAVKGREDEDIVFLGDYFDPYSYEGISREDALENFKEILNFKHSHLQNVTLLLGNHDLGYLCLEINSCRHDFARHEEINELLTVNDADFELCTSREINGKTYLFSHSFLNYYWLETCKDYFKAKIESPAEIADFLNGKYRSAREEMYLLLGMASRHRGGDYPFGSIVWSDINEKGTEDAVIDNIVNVFGHTQMNRPLIEPNLVCLDVRRGFELKADGTFCSIGG